MIKEENLEISQVRSLPRSWASTFLSELVTVKKGKNPNNLIEIAKHNTLPYIDIEAFEKGIFKRFAEANSGVETNEEDLLIVWDGARSGLVGKGIKGLLGSTIAALKPKISLDYLFYYLKLRYKDINTNTKGIGIPHVNPTFLWAIQVPLPPLPEQHRIVAEIEKQFTRLDAGVAALKQAQARLKRYKASVLKAACEGRLVPQDPSDEPAGVLLSRILTERRARWEADLKAKGKDPAKAKYEEPASPKIEELPELPQGWCWVNVEQIVNVGTGATPLRSKAIYYKNGTIPWVTSGALNNLFIYKPDELITEIAIKETNAKVFPRGTLLVALYGEGKTRGKVSELKIDAATNQACAGLVFKGIAVEIKLYIKLFFLKNYEDIRRFSSGGVQPNLNLSIIKQTIFPLPPLAEQGRIVAEVERRLSVVQELEAVVSANLKRAERLRQSILKRAFEGRLVPQDSTDEPAAVLLERIRQEREQNSRKSLNGKRNPKGEQALKQQTLPEFLQKGF